ncbi:FixH family protein [Ramlibacter sp. AW1]|uniref:FixH family protein n=1 Tax=Ramlibacter aurantiacus TaxID=2801330 RepID=A0A937D655_9BURK|nr:FixH family protein [Ramlibacter aurantiacus]MBL0420608.1 FixH family protein [Ramlibacter aurantiacus]
MTRVLSPLATLATSALIAACGTPPANLDLSLDKASAAGTYRVALQAPGKPPAINQLHAWTVKLAAADGHPVPQARFRVDGGMPQHGHGLPTQPRVTRELEPGTYLIEGMKFNMPGWWEIKLAVDAAPGSDQVTFNTVVATGGRP